MRPRIIITDKRQGKEIINTRVTLPFFELYSQAIATFVNGRELEWKQKGIFNRTWEWTENGIPIMRSTENNKLFTINGEISMPNEKN